MTDYEKERLAVIENIKRNTENGEFHSKVEINDPVLTENDEERIIEDYIKRRSKFSFLAKNMLARGIANRFTEKINKNTEILGEGLASSLEGGAIITSNHFSPLENTVIRHYALKRGKKHLTVVSNVGNFAMSGMLGFLMNYADTLPIGGGHKYMCRGFLRLLSEKLSSGEYVLIYPEEQMWFNYKKIRPLKRGTYTYAAKISCPIISCFVEQINLEEEENESFCKVGYRLHILGVIYPNPEKNVRENSFIMRDEDYRLKKEAYERIYNKPLEYSFSYEDIAGLKPGIAENTEEKKPNEET